VLHRFRQAPFSFSPQVGARTMHSHLAGGTSPPESTGNSGDRYRTDRESFRKPPGPRSVTEERLYRRIFVEDDSAMMCETPEVDGGFGVNFPSAALPARMPSVHDDERSRLRKDCGGGEGRHFIDDGDDDDDDDDEADLTSGHLIICDKDSYDNLSDFASTFSSEGSGRESSASAGGDSSVVSEVFMAAGKAAGSPTTAWASRSRGSPFTPSAWRWERPSSSASSAAGSESSGASRRSRRSWRGLMSNFGLSPKKSAVAPVENAFDSVAPRQGGNDVA